MDTIDKERDLAIDKFIKLRQQKDAFINNCVIHDLFNDEDYLKDCLKQVDKIKAKMHGIITSFVRKHHASFLLQVSSSEPDYSMSDLTASLSNNMLMTFLHFYKCPHPLSV